MRLMWVTLQQPDKSVPNASCISLQTRDDESILTDHFTYLIK